MDFSSFAEQVEAIEGLKAEYRQQLHHLKGQNLRLEKIMSERAKNRSSGGRGSIGVVGTVGSPAPKKTYAEVLAGAMATIHEKDDSSYDFICTLKHNNMRLAKMVHADAAAATATATTPKSSGSRGLTRKGKENYPVQESTDDTDETMSPSPRRMSPKEVKELNRMKKYKQLKPRKRSRRQHDTTPGPASTTQKRTFQFWRRETPTPNPPAVNVNGVAAGSSSEGAFFATEAAEESATLRMMTSETIERNTCSSCGKTYRVFTMLQLHRMTCGKQINGRDIIKRLREESSRSDPPNRPYY